jgi:hypothetical protein
MNKCRKNGEPRVRKKHRVEDPRPGQKCITMAGKTFGLLTVMEYAGLNEAKNRMWHCECRCGRVATLTTTCLRQGRSTSCGCSRYRKGADIYNYTGYQDITGTRWSGIRSNAESRSLKFEITKQDVWEQLQKQGHKCALSGLPVTFKDSSASVDRVDNAIGYTTSNIQILHKDVNLMRNKFDISYFIDMCRAITENNKIA